MSKTATPRKSAASGTALLDAPRPGKKPVKSNGSPASGRPGKMVYYFGQTRTEGDATMKGFFQLCFNIFYFFIGKGFIFCQLQIFFQYS